MVNSASERPRALFVLGVARSGTTVLGNYLGSSPAALNLGEYGGFHLTFAVVSSARPMQLVAEAYAADLRRHAREFVELLTVERGLGWYCDSTPWNILFADLLEEELTEPLYVLTLRHYSGTIQSLRRSYAGGYEWAGATWADSARIWAQAYEAVGKLPPARTIPVSYESLAEDPEGTLTTLHARLEDHGFDTAGLDLNQLVISHAQPHGVTEPRPTIGNTDGDGVRLVPMSSFDPQSWSGDIQAAIWPAVRDVHRDLQARFPSVYRSPSPPRSFWVHDEVEGLVREGSVEW
jgi:Sulfotransferase family